MVNFWRILFVIVLVFFRTYVTCADENEALHITRDHTRYIFDVVVMKKFGFPKLLYPTATACPARTEEENIFNTDNSFGKHSLFVRDTYVQDQTAQEVDYYVCHQPYKMSVVYHTTTSDFKFGFEIYYEKSKFDSKGFVDSDRREYNSIKDRNVYNNRVGRFYSRLPTVPVLSRIVSMPMQKPLFLDAEREKELGFMWIDLFHLKFDYATMRVAQAVYELSMATRGRKQCNNYDLGKEFFNDFDVDDLYHENNQEEMLKNVVLPTPEINGEVNEMACESENKCFAKWSTVPPEIFGFLAANPVSCSDLLTVPIWKSTIEDVLEKLDNFLYSLSVVIGHPVGEITVHSGTHGVLYLPISNSNIRSKKPSAFVKNGMQAPNIIYKLIKYKTKIYRQVVSPQNKNEETKTAEKKHPMFKFADTHKNVKLKVLDTENCDDDDKNDESNTHTAQMIKVKCEYATAAIIVVIHNDPYFNPETHKICEDVCEDAGWEIIKLKKSFGKEITSKYIYCCRATDKNVQKKLNIRYELNKEDGLTSASFNFSLKTIRMFDMKTKNFEERDVKDLVVKTYKHLFEGLKFEPFENEKWDVLMSSYHVKMQFLHMEAPIDDVKIEESENDEYELDKSESQLENKEETEKSISKNAELGEKKQI